MNLAMSMKVPAGASGTEPRRPLPLGSQESQRPIGAAHGRIETSGA